MEFPTTDCTSTCFIHCCVHALLLSFVSCRLESERSPTCTAPLPSLGRAVNHFKTINRFIKLSPPSHNKGAREPESGSDMSPTWQRASEGSQGLASTGLTVSCNNNRGEHSGSRNHSNADEDELLWKDIHHHHCMQEGNRYSAPLLQQKYLKTH